MSITQVLPDYLCHRFQWWKDSRLSYEPAQKTVYVYCQNLCEPRVLLPEAEIIARLDIGVDRFIITMPGAMDMVIKCQPNQTREKL